MDSARDLIGDLGPLAAVLAALYIGVWRERWRRPKLSLDLDPSSEADLISVGDAWNRAHYARLRVSNRRGRRSAEDVEVLVTQVVGRAYRPPIDTLPLRWSSLPGPTTRVTIPPGVTRHVDLLAVDQPMRDLDEEPDNVEGREQPAFLQIWPEPADGRHALGRGKYQIGLAVSARDTDVMLRSLTVEYGGQWRGGRVFWDGMQFGSLRRPLGPIRRRAASLWARLTPSQALARMRPRLPDPAPDRGPVGLGEQVGDVALLVPVAAVHQRARRRRR